MTLLAPAMLWSLLALIPLVGIYFLKIRPRPRPTTAFFLWESIFRERKATRLFQRLRDMWSLLLTALAVAAICLALARPQWADSRQDLLIVVDVSASMAAADAGGARIEMAKTAAREIIEGLNGAQRAAVASLANRLTYNSYLTDNPRELLDAIEQIDATNQRLAIDALPKLGEVRARGETDDPDQAPTAAHRVIFVSDGCLAGKALPAGVELLSVGEPLANVGLVAADMADVPGGSDRLAFYYQAASSYVQPVEADLTLSHVDAAGAEQLFKVIPLSIAPGANRAETFTLDNAPAGKWLARIETRTLEPADALATDNACYLTVIRPDPIRVAVESGDRFFLENSVLAFTRGDNVLELVDERADIVLSKSTTPEAERAMIFAPSGDSPWWTDLGEYAAVGVTRVLVDDHPALRHLDVSSIPFVGARRVTPCPGAQVLAADDAGVPLVYVARREGRSATVWNLDPVAADFYFSAWFPVSIHSAASFLAGREHAAAASYRPGQSAPILGSERDAVSSVLDPGGEAFKIVGPWFGLFERLGFYEVRRDEHRQLLAASLLSPNETLLDAGESEPRLASLSRGRSPAHWLTALALVALTAESLLYHRRKVG
ncbi:BatA and WFA domain-containing protein [Pirellulales bacterium]|nr:BatA and WFA domain-containing protein [Pirellulales bacterium]